MAISENICTGQPTVITDHSIFIGFILLMDVGYESQGQIGATVVEKVALLPMIRWAVDVDMSPICSF